MSTIVLLRHGQSEWNDENRFTGWADVDLSEQGVAEAHRAADQLLAEGLTFDLAFTSVLKRAIRTLWIVLDEMDLLWIPVVRAWQLNERHYGALQGLNKAETAEKYGLEQVYQWRRSYAVCPPALEDSDPRHPRFDRRYAELDPAQRPPTESLQDTCRRVLPYWERAIVPQIQAGKRIILSAHGNSLRALVKHLDGISDEDIPELNIPTGIPLFYEFGQDMRVVNRHYLGDPAVVQSAAEAVARQLGVT
jgi:2,3-bisphosphoglycerate-dependent phosphoglycerate mutase